MKNNRGMLFVRTAIVYAILIAGLVGVAFAFDAMLFNRGVVTMLVSAGLGLAAVIWAACQIRAGLEERVAERLDGLMHSLSRSGSLAMPASIRDEPGMHGAVERICAHAHGLQRSNEDLREFAFVAAHDLKAPLHAIQELAAWTLEDHGSELPQDVLTHIGLIQSRAARLSRLLSDLYLYARAGSDAAPDTEIDIVALAHNQLDLLNCQDRFTIDFDGPTSPIIAPLPIATIVMNLVTNAVRHHDRDVGRIRITVRANENDLIWIAVRDDGPGIAPEHHQRIFELFQTLSPRDETEFSGFGLAQARKLITTMGGGITVASNPATGRGTEFFLSFPGRIASTGARSTPFFTSGVSMACLAAAAALGDLATGTIRSTDIAEQHFEEGVYHAVSA